PRPALATPKNRKHADMEARKREGFNAVGAAYRVMPEQKARSASSRQQILSCWRHMVLLSGPVNSGEKPANLSYFTDPSLYPWSVGKAQRLWQLPDSCASRPNSSRTCAPGFRFRKSWAAASS